GNPAQWRRGAWITFGILATLFVAMFVVGLLGLKLKPDLIKSILVSQNLSAGAFIADSMSRRLQYIGSLITLVAIMVPAFSFLFSGSRVSKVDEEKSKFGSLTTFVLLLIILGALLVLGPDFLYLSDNFGYRINTVFKFYYQAWILLSLASAYAVAVLLRRLRG